MNETIATLRTKLALKTDEVRSLKVDQVAGQLALRKVHALELSLAEVQGQVKEVRRSHQSVEQSRDRYLNLYEFAPVGYLTLSLLTIVHINLTGARLLKRDRNQVLGRRLGVFIPAKSRTRFHRQIRLLRRDGDQRSVDVELLRGDDTIFHAQLDCVLIVTDDLPPTIRITVVDITQRKESEAEIRQLAFYDPLTSLPNRRLLLERLKRATFRCIRKLQHGAVLFIDLDNFKELNDTHGHSSGDLLLQQVARRLMSCVRACDTVARLGGDEFVVVLEELNKDPVLAASEALKIAEDIQVAFSERYALKSSSYSSTGSIGVALFNRVEESVEMLLQHADVALYRAKLSGQGAISFFDPAMQTAVTALKILDADLRLALADGQFVLYFQPQIDRAGHLMGAEALIRWQHPSRGLLLPASFIPFAEEKGFIEHLGAWVIEAACIELQRWSTHDHLASLTIAVNVSAREFRQPDFVARMLAIVDRMAVDPEKIMLEFTESLMFNTMEETLRKMTMLRARGIRFALDDFGIGYSSLSYLQGLPLDQLKIDQTFVRNVLTNPNDAVIVRSIIALGQSLGLDVVAEGVETDEQLRFLAANGCGGYQGFLFGNRCRYSG